MNLANADDFMTEKQKSNRDYYQAHKEEIIANQKLKRKESKEKRRYRRPGTRCLLCGGMLVKENNARYGVMWSCLEPDCEADFQEVVK